MALRFQNTLTNIKEDFKSIEPGKVGMYTCGPTVYNYAHIGNYRTYMFEDLLRCYLKYKGYDVTQVMNITDIDDKTIRDSQAQGVTLKEFTDPYTKAFFDDLDALGIDRAEHYPAATEHVPEMVAMISKLLDKGFAYESQGDYYYRISAFKDYGKLSNIDLTGLKAGARVAADEYEKDSVSDFALWKARTPEDGDVYFDTELGEGRPGWHIECSAMSTKYLGNHFDIHTGGVDNLFPHHENEIAQSQGATSEKFVNYWMHSEHLIVEGRKMSKSQGNYFTLRDILDKGYTGKAVRYLLIATHYRQQLNFTFDGLKAASNSLERYNDFITNLESYAGGESSGQADEAINGLMEGFEGSLDDNLNISGALGAVFDFIRSVNSLMADKKLSPTEKDEALAAIHRVDAVLKFRVRSEAVDSDIDQLIAKRNEARKNKDFALADKIRDDLTAMGIILEDTAEGVRWKRKV